MRLVVDTNIVFSTLLNPHSVIGEILINIHEDFQFFAPSSLKEELKRYSSRIAAYSKLNQNDLGTVETIVLSYLTFVPEESISEESWAKAFALTSDVDEDDTPFIALGIELDAKVWTGDKNLAKGLAKKGTNITITTAELKELIK